MTREELQARYDASTEKLNKRLVTLTKICTKKLNINADEVMKEYQESKKRNTKSWYPTSLAKEVVAKFVQEKPDRDENGDYIDANYDYNHAISDLADSIVKYNELEIINNNWKNKLAIEVERDEKPKIQILVDFLNNWGEMVFNWYKNKSETSKNKLNKYHDWAYNYLVTNNIENSWETIHNKTIIEDFNKAAEEYTNGELHHTYSYSHSVSPYLENSFLKCCCDYNGIASQIYSFRFNKEEDAMYEGPFYHFRMKGSYECRFDEAYLNKIIEADKKLKYEDLVTRVTSIVGEITDVSNLSIGHKGDIDGIVIGTDGKAKVQTISAGGYAVQCFHYRVLVDKIK